MTTTAGTLRIEAPVTACGCCGGGAFTTWKDKPTNEWAAVRTFCRETGDLDSAYLRIPERFTLVTCDGCGVALVNPRLADEVVNAFYEDYLSGRFIGRLQAYDEVFRYDALAPYVELLTAETAGRAGSILDVGCATGALLRHFQEAGWRTAGIDVSAYAAERARRFGDARCGDVMRELERQPAGAHDVVTLIDTLEHLAWPARVLQGVHRTLAPGGLALIEVPDVRAGFDEMTRHFYLFSDVTLSALLTTMGFIDVRTITLGHRYNPGDPSRPGRFLQMMARKPGASAIESA
jgi:SAM-dependent methyltransferase